MKTITISGLDGSGKSTQIKLLKKYFEAHAEKVFYFHGVDFSLANKIVSFKQKYCLLCKLRSACHISNSSSKSVTEASRFQIFLRKIFLYIDLWRFEILKRKLLKEKFSLILSDRFFYDAVVNVNYLAQKHNTAEKFSPKMIFTDTLAFYLNTNPENIMNRDRKPDQGISYLRKKKHLYEDFSKKWDMEYIDGNRNKELISREIIKRAELFFGNI